MKKTNKEVPKVIYVPLDDNVYEDGSWYDQAALEETKNFEGGEQFAIYEFKRYGTLKIQTTMKVE